MYPFVRSFHNATITTQFGTIVDEVKAERVGAAEGVGCLKDMI
jgi:hypothetical protein